MNTELVAFVNARYDEDEHIAQHTAQKTGGPHWHWAIDTDGDIELQDGGYITTGPSDISLYQTGEHMARHDPARVLRDVEAKRRIVSMYEAARNNRWTTPDAIETATAVEDKVEEVLGLVVRQLAAAYAEHEDYRDQL